MNFPERGSIWSEQSDYNKSELNLLPGISVEELFESSSDIAFLNSENEWLSPENFSPVLAQSSKSSHSICRDLSNIWSDKHSDLLNLKSPKLGKENKAPCTPLFLERQNNSSFEESLILDEGFNFLSDVQNVSKPFDSFTPLQSSSALKRVAGLNSRAADYTSFPTFRSATERSNCISLASSWSDNLPRPFEFQNDLSSRNNKSSTDLVTLMNELALVTGDENIQARSYDASQSLSLNGTPSSTPTKGCVFCKNNGYHATFYRAHVLKDEHGHCQCPVLRTYVCPLCSATGDAAHTLKYCPLNTVTRGDPVSAGLPPGKVTNWKEVAHKMVMSKRN